MTKLILINTIIGDRSYRIKIESKDEEVFRSTIKMLNEKIVNFKTNFAGTDMQDYIAMVLIWLATEKKAVEKKAVSPEYISQKLFSIESLLDRVL